jgi:hypothetical protein
MPGRPPLELHAEVTLADGTRYRWDASARLASDRPQGISFRTKKGEGFADAALTLSRRIDRDYVDLNLLDDFALVGYDGSVAYEGRVGANPRSLGESSHQMTLQLQGWMSHGKDRKFQEIWVDRDVTQWKTPPFNRQAGLAGTYDQGKLQVTADSGGLVWNAPNEALPTNTINEAWYAAPTGLSVAKVQYKGARVGTFTGFEGPLLVGNDSDDGNTSVGTYALTLDDTLRSQAITARRYLYLRALVSAGPVTPPVGTQQRYSKIAVYGNHGLTTRAIDSTTPDGLYASDVISNIAQRYCPRLSTTGVQPTTYAIPHLVHDQPIYPYDAWLDINKYHLWSLGVWENKTLTYKPYDLSDYDWEVRLSDPGVTIDLQGDSVDQLANGICVNFTDVVTGGPGRITPNDDSTLLDTNPNNPATTHGLTLWTEITLSSPTTAVAAAQIGRAALAEFNQPKAPGTIRVKGYIRDRAGHSQPAWKVRADQRIAITDHPNDRPRLIGETDWNHDQKLLTIGVDSTLQRVDAVLDRISTALHAANLT